MGNNTMFGHHVVAVHDANNNHIGLSTGGENIPLAMVYAFPDTPAVYTSPIAGEPNTTLQYSLSNLAQHLVTGFLLPKAGILTEIGYIAQGNTGGGVLKGVRWTVATIKNDSTALAGIAIDTILDTGLTDVADNFNGQAVLATGKSLAVPSQFVICLKAGISEALYVQLMDSAGPVPGVIGNVSSGILTPAATYSTSTIDVSFTDPIPLVSGDKIQTLSIKGIAVYTKWKGQ